jgi:hypothetical protein
MAQRDDDLDALFRLPLTEFVGARKLLAARIRKEKQAARADYVTKLAKPSISAWTVNQLYWQHRDAFESLLATGQRFHKVQKSGKVAEMREALDARRDSLTELSDLAAVVLRDAGHNPSIETIRRVATTLEALSAYASFSGTQPEDRPIPGLLTHDIDPPGFESFAGFKPGSPTAVGLRGSTNSELVATGTKRGVIRTVSLRRSKNSEPGAAKLAAARLSLQNAKKSLAAARAKAERLEAAKKRLEAALKDVDKHKREAEKQSRQAEQRLNNATAGARIFGQRLDSVVDDLNEATEAIKTQQEAVDLLTTDLESLS